MNSEAEKNPGGLNIRQELEALRENWREHFLEMTTEERERSEGFMACASDLDALLQRIPDGWDLRPREPSGEMIDAYHHTYMRNLANPIFSPREKMACQWRAMWDAASEEKQKYRQIADLREALCDLEEMATKCDDGQYIDYPGARSIFCRARSALAKANQSEPTEGTPENSHDDDR